jgi:phospholipid/cholesterol/gamma-HCH transport system permease protein
MRSAPAAASDDVTRPQPACLDVERPEPGALEIQLSGAWVLRAPRPAPSEVESAIGESGLQRVRFTAEGLESWDTGILTFLAAVIERLRRRSIDIDLSGLPRGVQRLLELAEAVPEKEGARQANDRPPWLSRLGTATSRAGEGGIEFVSFVGEVSIALFNALRLKARIPIADVWLFVQGAGAEALPIVTLISFLVGLILAFVGAVQLQQFGATIFVANLVQIGMAREMGAIMTGVIMAGRTGAAFAAQLGTMKVTEEIDALTTLGIRPVEYLVVPRVLALSLMMPLLCIYSDLVGIVGGGVVGVGLLDQNLSQYIQQTLYYASATQFLIGISKSFVFGILIALASCLRGMQCGSSASAVGDAATSAVVTSIVLIVVSDGLFAVLCNALNI